jgi:hypothetical protein
MTDLDKRVGLGLAANQGNRNPSAPTITMNTPGTKRKSSNIASMRPPRGEILVELTGIEPVASWLQTRRSPS